MSNLPFEPTWVGVDTEQFQRYIDLYQSSDIICDPTSRRCDMTQQTKRIGLSDQQRREAVSRTMSGVIVSEHRARNAKKVRRNIIRQMCVAFTKAAHDK